MADTEELEAFVEDTVLNQNSAKSLLLVQAILALSKLENSLVAGGPSAWTPRHKTLAALARRIDGLPSAQVRSYGRTSRRYMHTARTISYDLIGVAAAQPGGARLARGKQGVGTRALGGAWFPAAIDVAAARECVTPTGSTVALLSCRAAGARRCEIPSLCSTRSRRR